MVATRFELQSNWHLPASLDRVWGEISTPDAWPSWWRAVKRVEKLRDGDAAGLGAVRRFTWGTALPYTITFDMEATRIEPQSLLEGRATGELTGFGRWTLRPEAGGTYVHYDWVVDVTKPWQVALAPVLRPMFAWNHNVVMGWGDKDIRARLGVGSS